MRAFRSAASAAEARLPYRALEEGSANADSGHSAEEGKMFRMCTASAEEGHEQRREVQLYQQRREVQQMGEVQLYQPRRDVQLYQQMYTAPSETDSAYVHTRQQMYIRGRAEEGIRTKCSVLRGFFVRHLLQEEERPVCGAHSFEQSFVLEGRVCGKNESIDHVRAPS